MELFSEIYGTYYNTVAALVKKAQSEPLSEREVMALVREHAFEESVLALMPNIRDEEWKLFKKGDAGYETVIQNVPRMPLTHLQKRWLKAISLDPRFGLFCDGISGLENVEPLYTPDDIIYYDQIAGGDNYADPNYKTWFRLILRALRERRKLRIAYVSGKGRRHNRWFFPHKLEYSVKDDKFRLYVLNNNTFQARDFGIINLSRILFAELGEPFEPNESILPTDDEMKKSVELIITNERNALERAMLHFANYQKQTEKLDEDTYRMKLWYYGGDETEVLIRVISFGPFIRAVSPGSFVEQIRQRLGRQKALSE